MNHDNNRILFLPSVFVSDFVQALSGITGVPKLDGSFLFCLVIGFFALCFSGLFFMEIVS